MVCVQPESEGRRNVWRNVQSQLPKCLLPDVSGIRTTVAVRWGDVTIWNVTVRNIAILPWSNVADIFTNITRAQLDFAGLLADESPLFTHISIVLTDVAPVQSPVTIL